MPEYTEYRMPIGYHFKHDGRGGILDVLISAYPSGKFFDPEIMTLNVAASERDVEPVSIYYPWTGRTRFRVCAGRIILRDRRNRVVQGFTFGGDLSIITRDQMTACVIKSPVPIIQLTLFGESELTMLATQADVLLAQRRAAWSRSPQVFEQRRASADPLALYTGCLQSLQSKFQSFPPAALDGLMQQFRVFLGSQLGILERLPEWPVINRPLEEQI